MMIRIKIFREIYGLSGNCIIRLPPSEKQTIKTLPRLYWEVSLSHIRMCSLTLWCNGDHDTVTILLLKGVVKYLERIVSAICCFRTWENVKTELTQHTVRQVPARVHRRSFFFLGYPSTDFSRYWEVVGGGGTLHWT